MKFINLSAKLLNLFVPWIENSSHLLVDSFLRLHKFLNLFAKWQSILPLIRLLLWFATHWRLLVVSLCVCSTVAIVLKWTAFNTATSCEMQLLPSSCINFCHNELLPHTGRWLMNYCWEKCCKRRREKKNKQARAYWWGNWKKNK